MSWRFRNRCRPLGILRNWSDMSCRCREVCGCSGCSCCWCCRCRGGVQREKWRLQRRTRWNGDRCSEYLEESARRVFRPTTGRWIAFSSSLKMKRGLKSLLRILSRVQLLTKNQTMYVYTRFALRESKEKKKYIYMFFG